MKLGNPLAAALCLALSTNAMAAAAQAKPPLREVAVIDDGLFAVAMADEIRNKCDGVSARLITAYTFLSRLKSKARELGYSDDEIDDHVTSKPEKARMRARGEAYLKANGVTLGDKSGYCRLGKQEIAKGSQIGALLKAR
nr:DUF5333 domain-containing protein [Puniceibacterium sp. IMCC21224]